MSKRGPRDKKVRTWYTFGFFSLSKFLAWRKRKTFDRVRLNFNLKNLANQNNGNLTSLHSTGKKEEQEPSRKPGFIVDPGTIPTKRSGLWWFERYPSTASLLCTTFAPLSSPALPQFSASVTWSKKRKTTSSFEHQSFSSSKSSFTFLFYWHTDVPQIR